MREPLNLGICTSKDPALLNVGELQRATNCHYRPPDTRLYRVPGRTRYNSSAEESNPVGLVYLEFDPADPNVTIPRYLILHVGTTYRISTLTTEAGTFSDLATGVGTGVGLEAIAFDEFRVLLNGNSDTLGNKIVYLALGTGTPTVKSHGMTPVSSNVTLATSAGSGWPTGVEWGNGNYFFFVTEIDRSTPFETESTYMAQPPPSINISGTTDGVSLTLPAKTNSTATQFRIYAAGPYDTDQWSDLYFLQATVITEADISLASTAVTLGNAASSSEEKTAGAASDPDSRWTGEGNITADDDVLASGQADRSGHAARLIASTFGFTTGSMGTVRGIEVRIQAKLLKQSMSTQVDLSPNNGSSFVDGTHFFTVEGTTPHTYFLKAGGPNDLWGRSSWTPGTELINAQFQVRIKAVENNSANYGNQEILQIDYVKVKVYWSSTKVLSRGDNFPCIVYNAGPITVVMGANGPPPVAATGCTFEGSLLTDDSADGSIVRYSLPDSPEYFPLAYFLNLETGSADLVRWIRRLHNVAIVGLSNKIVRINTLPRAEDPSFDTGRAWDVLDGVHGACSRKAVAFFNLPGEPEMLAYASYSGLRWTNGSHTSTLTEDIDWPNTVNVAKLQYSTLVNYPNRHALKFSYVPADDTTSTYPTRTLWLSYHPSFIKENGKLTVVGPAELGSTAFALGSLGSTPILFSVNSAGYVHVEDRGYADPAGGLLQPDIVTRDIYPSGLGTVSRVERMYVRYGFNDPGLLLTVTPYIKNNGTDHIPLADGQDYLTDTFRTNSGQAVPGGQSTLINAGGLAKLTSEFAAESFALRIQGTDIPGQAAGAMALDSIEYLATEVEKV